MKCKHESYLRRSNVYFKTSEEFHLRKKQNKRKMNDLEPELRFYTYILCAIINVADQIIYKKIATFCIYALYTWGVSFLSSDLKKISQERNTVT